MCEHSQAQALTMGFKAMQFNFVVATNTRAIRLWIDANSIFRESFASPDNRTVNVLSTRVFGDQAESGS